MTSPTWIALDGGWATTGEAERDVASALAGRGGAPLSACTHFVPGHARVVVTAHLAPGGDLETTAIPDPAQRGMPRLDREVLQGLTAAHRDRRSGRAFHFPGQENLTAILMVGELTASTAIEAVVPVGGTQLDADTKLDPQDFVRPVYADGSLVLHVRPGNGDTVVPFEQPQPTPCCADHI